VFDPAVDAAELEESWRAFLAGVFGSSEVENGMVA
jgi:hypothetical protein